MANTMGTLTDNKDGNSARTSVNGTAAMDDRTPGTGTPHDQSPTTSTAGKKKEQEGLACDVTEGEKPKLKVADSYNITVKGSENSTVTENSAIGVFNYTVNNNGKKQEGLACDVTEGEKPKLKISVPAEDGGTIIHVHCTKGKVRHWSYERDVDIEKTFVSRWTFGNIFDGLMAAIINGKNGDDFFDLMRKLKERYDCKVYNFHKKCLVIAFLHETEDGRDSMIKEKETVKQMFQTFIEGIKPNAPACTLEVSTEKETTPISDKPDTELKHIEQDVSVPSTSKIEKVQAQGMLTREYKWEERFQSVSDDERKEMEYSVERRKHDRFRARMSMDKLHTRPTRARMSMDKLRVEHEPIPESKVHLYDCRRCSEVLQNRENKLSALRNLHFIHFDPNSKLGRDVKPNFTSPNSRDASKLQFTKILSAFRNSQGGVLIVHQRNTSDSLDKFISQIIHSVLTHDLVTCDVFKSKQIGKYKDMFRIDVQPSEMYVTHDYKTKFPSLLTGIFENASNERIRHLLFSSRTTESTVAALQGISSRQQNVKDLRMRYTRHISLLSGPSEPPRHQLKDLVYDIDVDDIMTSHSVPEHITSLSKKKSGGSMFVVIAGLIFHDTPLHQQELIKDHLMQALKKNLLVQKNKHSKVSLQDIDVFKIRLSKDADSDGCIIEIAVGRVNGCVFYDPQGPESYKIEGEKIVRLPIEKWVEEAFE